MMDMNYIEQLFNDYGYWLLFIGLVLEFVALPFPGETTLTYAGYLSHIGVIHWLPSMLLAFAGTTIGMSITYIIGYKAGAPFIERYGKWFFLTHRTRERTKRWFDKYGGKVLFIGYFIPGVRHFTGYFSGMMNFPFRTFALYAYSGAFFWVVFFISLGNLLGPQWEVLFDVIERYAWILVAVLGCSLVIYIGFKLRSRAVKLKKLHRHKDSAVNTSSVVDKT